MTSIALSTMKKPLLTERSHVCSCIPGILASIIDGIRYQIMLRLVGEG